MSAVAILKIGSTTTALLVANELSAPLLYQQRVVNLFDSDAPKRLNDVLADFTRFADNHGCSRRLAAGGEAVRQCPPLHAVIKRWGWPHWAVDGELEGHLTWFAVKASEGLMDWVIDIGGGSTEFASADQIVSLPVGAATQQTVYDWPEGIYATAPYVVGGTAHALSILIGNRQLLQTDIGQLKEAVQANPTLLDFMDPVRRRIFPQGLQVLYDIMQYYHWPLVTYTPYGYIHGIWLACTLGRNISLRGGA